jgi:hypothetical protein
MEAIMLGMSHKPAPRPAPETEGPHFRRIVVKPGPGKVVVKHDHLGDYLEIAGDRQEALIDEGVEESFPASDPLSPKHIT